MRELPEIAHDITLVRRESLRRLLEEHGYASDLADEAMRLFLHHRNKVRPYPEVAEVLRDLSHRHWLVSVTNGNSDPARTPLRGLFHRSLNAAMAGAAKPDPAMFRMAVEWAGMRPDQALHVGDDPHLDVAAAQAAGLTAVWVNRDGCSWPLDLDPPVTQVADLKALANWIEGEGRAL
jgi:2-haloalkanoic acid dehalogenase type II